MIPVNDFLYEEKNIKERKSPNKMWKISGKRMQGTVDELNAVIQGCIKMLNTEAEVYEIYSESYGIKTLDLIGKDIDYALLTLKRRITESLANDERIKNVSFVDAEVIERRIKLKFEVSSIYGNFELERTVKV